MRNASSPRVRGALPDTISAAVVPWNSAEVVVGGVTRRSRAVSRDRRFGVGAWRGAPVSSPRVLSRPPAPWSSACSGCWPWTFQARTARWGAPKRRSFSFCWVLLVGFPDFTDCFFVRSCITISAGSSAIRRPHAHTNTNTLTRQGRRGGQSSKWAREACPVTHLCSARASTSSTALSGGRGSRGRGARPSGGPPSRCRRTPRSPSAPRRCRQRRRCPCRGSGRGRP